MLLKTHRPQLSFDEQPIPDINPDKLDVQVVSGLFAGLRKWNERTAENLSLLVRHQGRVVPTRLIKAGEVVMIGKSTYDPNKRYLSVKKENA